MKRQEEFFREFAKVYEIESIGSVIHTLRCDNQCGFLGLLPRFFERVLLCAFHLDDAWRRRAKKDGSEGFDLIEELLSIMVYKPYSMQQLDDVLSMVQDSQTDTAKYLWRNYLKPDASYNRKYWAYDKVEDIVCNFHRPITSSGRTSNVAESKNDVIKHHLNIALQPSDTSFTLAEKLILGQFEMTKKLDQDMSRIKMFNGHAIPGTSKKFQKTLSNSHNWLNQQNWSPELADHLAMRFRMNLRMDDEFFTCHNGRAGVYINLFLYTSILYCVWELSPKNHW